MDKSIVLANQLAVRSSTSYEFSNSNPAEVVEIEDDDTSVGTVEKQMEELKLNYQFNEKDVPQIFKTLVNDQIRDLKEIFLDLKDSFCLLKFNDFHVRFEKKTDHWTVTYEQVNAMIEVDDPEKSIIDHLWFVLKNPDIKLEKIGILNYQKSEAEDHQKLDSGKLNTLLQSMLNSIDHQIQTNLLDYAGFDEDILLSLVKRVDPETLDHFYFNISWKEGGNYQKMKVIVETDQWKLANRIFSHGVTPLKVDDLFHCERSWLELDSVTPEDVLRVVENAFNASSTKTFVLSCKPEKYDIDAIIDFLRSQNDGLRITKVKPTDHLHFKIGYKIRRFGKFVLLVGNENYIAIQN